MTIQDDDYTHSQVDFDEMCELLVYSSAPHNALDWDLVVVSPGGQQVAVSLVWIDPRVES